MSAGYVIARENFKEAAKHVSAETDPSCLICFMVCEKA